MTQVMTVSQARTNIYKLMDETAASHEPILITGKRNNVVMISQEDWNVMQEMLHLNTIPGMVESIKEGLNTSVQECATEVQW